MFSGKAKDYALFKLMFRSYAVVNKFKVALIEPSFTLLDREDNVIGSENPDASKIEKFIDANEMAMSCLCMAFEDKSMISYVRGTFTKKWPTGLAFKVLEALDQAFLPDDHIAMSQVQVMIATVRVKATEENPQAMFTKFLVTSLVMSSRKMVYSWYLTLPCRRLLLLCGRCTLNEVVLSLEPRRAR
jgi:hypothetical protein